MDSIAIETLVERALTARKNCYAPYSKFLVGSAILLKNGEIITGVNIENASYPVTICAERSAMASVISQGFKDEIVALAVHFPVSQSTEVFSHTLNTHNLALDFQELVSSAAAFHAHVAIPVGLKLKIWERIGNSRIVGDSQRICFRICNDYGRPGLQSSQDWSVWRIGMPMNRIGPLNEHSRLCEIGLVVNPLSIVSRIRTGKYDFAYPSG